MAQGDTGPRIKAVIVNPAELAILINAAAHASAYDKALGFKWQELPRADNWGGWIESNLLGAPKDGFATIDFNNQIMRVETELQKKKLKQQAADAIKAGPTSYFRFHRDIGKVISDKEIFTRKMGVVEAINHPGDDNRREVMKRMSEIQLVSGIASKVFLFASGVLCPMAGMAFGFAADIMEERSKHPEETIGAIIARPLTMLTKDVVEMAVHARELRMESIVNRFQDLQKDKAEIEETMRAISAQLGELFPGVSQQPGYIARRNLGLAASKNIPALRAEVTGMDNNMHVANNELAEVKQELAAFPDAEKVEQGLRYSKVAGKLFRVVNVALLAHDINELIHAYKEQNN